MVVLTLLLVVESGVVVKEVVPVVIGWMLGWAFVVILVEEEDAEDVEDVVDVVDDVDVAPLMPMLLIVADGAAAAAAWTRLTVSPACVLAVVTDVVSTIVTALVLDPATGAFVAFVDLVSFVPPLPPVVVVTVLSFLTSAMFVVSFALMAAGAVPVSDCGSSSDKKRPRMLNMVDDGGRFYKLLCFLIFLKNFVSLFWAIKFHTIPSDVSLRGSHIKH